ncbi:hypothetical protein [Phenylobacterium sp.]|uniref:hypothetical protein n=1 Tax=Phenylobacterium sp. TaxID=1871053 RepID=UPI001221EC6E|nr:hypothetical protein [Phenylobacterium sp.]THD64166.1 MAG: hypothetical protein E8A12_08270 [Phenylobacterium sp.]
MLYEIAEGVHGGSLKARDLVAIVPVSLNGEHVGEKNYIEFDVSVVVSEAEEKKAGGDGKLGGEINVASVAKISASLGGTAEGSSSAKAEQTHRVTFKVPIYWAANYRDNPATKAEAAAFEARRAEN